ncbi:MAG: DR1-associated protein 1 (negative cofactor 2 alpha) [Caeruleum heppii]|nr:MAG: DR1-associated protein 1 (negative cofactor 2 alpha) [Caeruleum heppii]
MDEEGTYAPESPDLSAYQTTSYPVHSSYAQPSYAASPYYHPPPQQYPPGYGQPPPVPYDTRDPQQLPMAESAGLRSRNRMTTTNKAPATVAPVERNPRYDVEVKTKFPVARIKRIMQADEDVGKVAQVTPVAVSKALELFMIDLVSRAAEEGKAKSSKRITATHLKRAVEKETQFDFLWEITSKVQDAPAPSEHADDSNEGADSKKRKGPPRKRRKGSDDVS